MSKLTLAQAIANGDLEAFVRQAEADGIGPADRDQFDRLLDRVTVPQQADQTSRSRAGGGSPGK